MTKPRLTGFLFLLALLITVFSLVGCSGREKIAFVEGDYQAEAPVVIVYGVEPGFAPFEMVGEDGSLKGFDIDLINAIGEVSNVEMQPRQMKFADLLSSIETGAIDCAISSISIDDTRKQTVDFSVPYYVSELCVVVQADNETIQSFDDLEGQRIGVQSGTTAMQAAEEIPHARVNSYDSFADAVMELESGAIDAVVSEHPVAGYYIAQGSSKVKVITSGNNYEYYGIAVSRQKPDTLKLINEALFTLRDNGKYAAIYKHWFSTHPPAGLPEEMP